MARCGSKPNKIKWVKRSGMSLVSFIKILGPLYLQPESDSDLSVASNDIISFTFVLNRKLPSATNVQREVLEYQRG